MEILNCLKRFPIVVSVEVLALRTFHKGFFIKLKVILRDGSLLYIREYVDIEERNYSYHWQTADGRLIIRWDNAPHHKNIQTYPHHKHIGNSVVESFEITCEKILEFIEKEMEG